MRSVLAQRLLRGPVFRKRVQMFPSSRIRVNFWLSWIEYLN